MKVVVHCGFGGFSLELERLRDVCKAIGIEPCDAWQYGEDLSHRVDPVLVKAVEDFDRQSHLRVIDIPEGIDWYIDAYDGWETIREVGHEWPARDYGTFFHGDKVVESTEE